MQIIELEYKDILQIKPLWEKLNHHHWQQSTHFKDHFSSFTFGDRIRQLETREAIGIFAAMEQDDLVGYCLASLKEQAGEIDSIFIHPEFRSRNLGKRLMETAESWLSRKGALRLRVCVAQGNESAMGFYHEQGYVHRFTVLERKV